MEVGDIVILGRHDLDPSGFPQFWTEEMDQYIGRTAKITKRVVNDTFIICRVDIDNEVWQWREVNMRLVDKNNMNCIKCKEQMPYVGEKKGHLCWKCRH